MKLIEFEGYSGVLSINPEAVSAVVEKGPYECSVYIIGDGEDFCVHEPYAKVVNKLTVDV